ncbi:sensor histidine kinase [Pedobacter sp. N23S346]|uniref:sensor histidine kinase n=1 Tax=Pedobacter sp. N23S346 TaxID=3402750 RepID=UPI003AC18349
MHSAQIPDQSISANEELHLQTLLDYEILDTPAEKSFDNFAQLAADIFEVQNAAIGFFAENGIFYKAVIGSEIGQKKSEYIFNLGKSADKILIPAVENQSSNMNTQSPGFFAGGIIKSPGEQNLGVIMVYGDEPRVATKHQLAMLSRLAEMVSEKLETRMAIRKTMRALDDRLHVLIHDLKNPMTTISLQSELVSRMPDAGERVASIAGKINLQSKRMVDNLNDILSSARKENGSFKPQKNKIDLKTLLDHVTQDLKLALAQKNQSVTIKIDEPVEIFGDEVKLQELFSQLLQNASKFSKAGSKIVITHQLVENLVTIAIKDYGVGLSEDDLNRLFIKFSRLSAQPTDRENGHGLGLIVAKMFADMHKGKIWATSEGIDKGTTLYVELPLK